MTPSRTLAAAALAGLAAAAYGASPDDLLEPDQAFQPSARLVAERPSGPSGAQPAGIEVEYRIAEGYYLYRDRLRFEMVPKGLPVSPPQFPPATEMDDPFIGKTFVFRKRAVIVVPLAGTVADPGRYRLRITAQGCAEDRFCYSPFRQEVAIGAAAAQ